ncbi:MAG TPA: hypothetical protein VEO53_07705 [Candidatus Binatia bacterium]|nr:hypothetical protein [Candidatus Binatia bacterium]
MKAISFPSKRLLFGLAVLAWLPLWSGCRSAWDESLTAKLWHSPTFRNFNEPASNPNVRLFEHEGGADLLVQYDEVREKDGAVRGRAFFLNRNLKRLQEGRKPQFVHTNAVGGLKPVPVLVRRHAEPVPAAGWHVIVSEDRQTFTLHAGGTAVDTFRLPIYETSGGKVQRTLLTPFTVTGDVVCVGLYVGAVAAVLWLEGGAPGLNCR